MYAEVFRPIYCEAKVSKGRKTGAVRKLSETFQ